MSNDPYSPNVDPDVKPENTKDPAENWQVEYNPSAKESEREASPGTMPDAQPDARQSMDTPSQSADIQASRDASVKEQISPTHAPQADLSPLFVSNEVDEMHTRWTDIQVQFVDSPCSAVEQGDALVAEIVERIKQTITDQQDALNKMWLNHDDISTEELRVTLLQYRSFLNRLLKL